MHITTSNSSVKANERILTHCMYDMRYKTRSPALDGRKVMTVHAVHAEASPLGVLALATCG